MSTISNRSFPTKALVRGAMGVGKQGSAYLRWKRVFDILIAVCALLITGPVLLIGILAVKFTSPGPIFYRARRAGLGGQPFTMLKLRSMYVGTDSLDRRVTAVGDDRITPVGVWLRKFKIDELPQFWNVLRGEMSMVGPRPEDWNIVQNYYTPEHWRTLDVRPGVMSLAEIRWYPDLAYFDPPPAGVPMQEYYLARHMPLRLAEEQHHVTNQSLWLDLKVIWQTAVCVLWRSWQAPQLQRMT
jgi:lipopolysaccharide/colanic/teichoic acid biosynthesis glycosyltransferase